MTESEKILEELKEQQFIQRMVYDECYLAVRKVEHVGFIGVQKMLYTVALVVGMSDYGYERRYCYEHQKDAMNALFDWNGEGDPPGPWIKQKGDWGDRINPYYTGGI